MDAVRFTSKDLEGMPDDGKRYEIIDGELYVSKQPGYHHQFTCSQAITRLTNWSNETGAGVTLVAPGVIFAPDDDVAPDIVWLSRERLAAALGPTGHLHLAPELVVEVLSPGRANERRDREAKLGLYGRRGVVEYWICDWRPRMIEVYRRVGTALQLVETLYAADTLRSLLLPGFSCPVATLFADGPSV